MKLLRFLQDQIVERVGGRQKIQVDVRIVSATNANLDDKISQGVFRGDLLYRMNSPRRFSGYLMPRVSGMRPIFSVYNPLTRRRETPLFNYRYLMHTARNLASAVRALHRIAGNGPGHQDAQAATHNPASWSI